MVEHVQCNVNTWKAGHWPTYFVLRLHCCDAERK